MTHQCPKCGYSDDGHIYLVSRKNVYNQVIWQAVKTHSAAMKHKKKGAKIFLLEVDKLVEYKDEKGKK